MRSLAAVAVALCVVVAGCSALPGGGGGPTADPGTAGDPADTRSGGPNPWGTQTLVVGVSAPAYENRSFAGAAESAVAFWNPRTGTDTPFEADLTVDPDAADPDIELLFTPRVDDCDGEDGTFYWCAPAFPDEPDTYTLRITASTTDRALSNATTRAFAGALATDPDEVDSVPTVDRPRFRDPWPGSPTVVGLDTAVADRPVRPLVESSLAYWERIDADYGNYTTDFVLRPDAEDPDVLVQFVDSIGTCGSEGDDAFIGCAPVLSDRQLAEPPTLVRVETGYTDESTELALRHELGHVYGLEHGEGPGDLMDAASAKLDRQAQPNATERAFPWESERITVFVDRPALPGTDAEIDRQLSAAFDYYEDGADGTVPESVSIERTGDREAADIVVTATEMDAASNESLYGSDTDVDPALEYYTGQTIYVDIDIDPQTLGWHVGYWLGDSLTGADSALERPPPFDEPQTDPRREWWN